MAHRSRSEPSELSALERIAVVALGTYLAATGANAIVAGRWMYPNYLRWPVAAPVALVIGALLIVAGVALRR